ncbi:MAG TPA: hypothetical protein VJ853_08905 [Thermoanaerobaculia bacterium]|nr:hypothetical protein [Thermoanaerobaculia bacterium]
MILPAALFWFATAAEQSRSLTAAAEQLLKVEKEIAASNDKAEFLLYGDVLALLDEAVSDDATNVHARALSGEVLLLQSENDDGTYDVCSLVEARDDANFVLKHNGGAADTTIARQVIKAIDAIPPDEIPDDPSTCEGEKRHGSQARSS